MSAFPLLLRGRFAALRDDVLQNGLLQAGMLQTGLLQNSVPRSEATPRADARKLSHPSLRRLPPHPTSA